MALVPRRALKIVGIIDGSYGLMMKLPDAEAVVTVAHVQPGTQGQSLWPRRSPARRSPCIRSKMRSKSNPTRSGGDQDLACSMR